MTNILRVKERSKTDALGDIIYFSVLNTAIATLLRYAPTLDGDDERTGLQNAINFIHTSFAQNPSLTTVATMSGYQVNYFCRKFRSLTGIENDTLKNKINGVTYACENNPMGISKFTFTFNGKKGVFTYYNAQGKKKIPFGINHNVFGKFPQLGYSNEHGGVQTTDLSTTTQFLSPLRTSARSFCSCKLSTAILEI